MDIRNAKKPAGLPVLSLILAALAGCGPDARFQEYAGTYVLDKEYVVDTLELAADGSFAFERRYTEEEHPMVREAYRGRSETEEGEWSLGRDRIDGTSVVILLVPSPPNITRFVVDEDGDLVEFMSDNVFRKQ